MRVWAHRRIQGPSGRLQVMRALIYGSLQSYPQHTATTRHAEKELFCTFSLPGSDDGQTQHMNPYVSARTTHTYTTLAHVEYNTCAVDPPPREHGSVQTQPSLPHTRVCVRVLTPHVQGREPGCARRLTSAPGHLTGPPHSAPTGAQTTSPSPTLPSSFLLPASFLSH